MPSPTSAVALSPPLQTIPVFDACRTQCGAHCAVRGACAEGRTDGPVQGVSFVSTPVEVRAPRPLPLLHSPLSLECKHRLSRHQIVRVGRGRKSLSCSSAYKAIVLAVVGAYICWKVNTTGKYSAYQSAPTDPPGSTRTSGTTATTAPSVPTGILGDPRKYNNYSACRNFWGTLGNTTTTAPAGISRGPPKIQQLRRLSRLRRLQEFLETPGTTATTAPMAHTGISG